MKEDRLSVFEITHDKLRERYVGVTPLSLERLIDEHKRVLPRRIAHWGPPVEASYRIVESDMGHGEAIDFVERYVEVMRQAGWRTILDLPARYVPLPPFDKPPPGSR